jgi:hypothetical protein
MKRIVPLLAILLLGSVPLLAQEAFSKAGPSAAKTAATRYVSANSIPFKVSVAAPAVVLAHAQASYSLCAAAAADPKCPKTSEVNGTARLTIRGADGKAVASDEVTFRQGVTAEGGRESVTGSVPLSIHVLAPSLAPGTYTADLEFRSNANSQSFSLSGGRVDVMVMKSRLK